MRSKLLLSWVWPCLALGLGLAALDRPVLAEESPLKLESDQQADPRALMNWLRETFQRFTDPPAATPVESRTAPASPEPQLETSEPSAETVVGRASRPIGPCWESELDRDETRELQALLNEILSDADEPGTIDGICGPRTEAAIRAFEEEQGHEPKGVPTGAILAQVREVGATVANRAIMQPVGLPGDPALWRRRQAELPEAEPQPAAAAPESDPAALPGDPALWRN